MRTPAPQRAAGRRKLAAKGQALAGGTAPIPDLAYLKKAIRAKGRVDPARWPALKALIRKRAKELGALNAPGVKGTWAFQGSNDGGTVIENCTISNDSTGALDMSMPARRTPMVRGMADVQASRSGPGVVTVMHKSTGAKIGTVTAAASGYQGNHVSGAKTPASGTVGGAMAGLIAWHNKMAAQKAPPAANAAGIANLKGYANDGDALDLAGSLPHSTPAVTSGDGPRVTTVSGSKSAASATGVTAEVAKVYKKLLAKGMKPGQAMALAKRAAAMHVKASAKAA